MSSYKKRSADQRERPADFRNASTAIYEPEIDGSGATVAYDNGTKVSVNRTTA